MKKLTLANPEEMERLGSELAGLCQKGNCIYLKGELGAGKTTIVRGFLRGMGYSGKVKSPTYTLVEPYEFKNIKINHFDLYRLDDPMELEAIGFRDYFDGTAISLVEWPEKAQRFLREPDILIQITMQNDAREVVLQGCSQDGEHGLARLELSLNFT